jgi:elongation factor G
MEEMNVRGHFRNLDGVIPLAETRGYATDLRSLTQGRGTFSMEPYMYAPAQADVMERLGF